MLGVTGVQGSLEDLFSGVTTLLAPYSPHSTVNVDGTISPGEYNSNVTYTTSDTGISLSLIHDNDSLFVGIEGPSWRWVALGVSSDNGSTMGFIVIARAGSGSEYLVQERLASPVTEEMTFLPLGAHLEVVKEFKAAMSGNDSIVELQLLARVLFMVPWARRRLSYRCCVQPHGSVRLPCGYFRQRCTLRRKLPSQAR